ncbi:MAG: hypothetical protein R2725_06815 [Solirubrobacterales bacterium]
MDVGGRAGLVQAVGERGDDRGPKVIGGTKWPFSRFVPRDHPRIVERTAA